MYQIAIYAFNNFQRVPMNEKKNNFILRQSSTHKLNWP